MKPQAHHRPPASSLASVLGLPCALLSLASGSVALVVSFILWWQGARPEIQRIGQHAGFFSAVLGLLLAGIATASARRRVRVLAFAALLINLVILAFTLDNIFKIFK